jgi:hypothetical protein
MIISLIQVAVCCFSSTVSATSESAFRSNESLIDFFLEDFGIVQQRIRTTFPNANTFMASSVEDYFQVPLISKNASVVCFDFDGDNGFLVADYSRAYLFASKGSMPFTRDPSLIFSPIDGFGSIDSWGNFSSLYSADFLPSQERFGHYEGQEADAEGYGKIIDEFAYVNSRYGDGYQLSSEDALPNWPYTQQSNFSIYQKTTASGERKLENNCVPASIYEVLKYFQVERSKPFPADFQTFNPETDPFYSSDLFQPNSQGESYQIIRTNLPSLYLQIRRWFVDNDQYFFDGCHPAKITDCVESLFRGYEVGMSTTSFSTISFEQDILNNVRSGNTILLWNSVSDTYGFHTMPITGCSLFSKTTGWWIFQHTDYVKLVRLNDNLVPSPRYLDFNQYSLSSIGGSFDKISL